jgi:hypothetical protein
MTPIPPSGESRRADDTPRRRSIGDAALRSSRNVLRFSANTYIPGLRGTVEGTSGVLNDSATLVRGARVSGFWHYSSEKKDHFDRDKLEQWGPWARKFGSGAYLGLDRTTGETIAERIRNGATRYDVALHDANILVLNRAEVKEVSKNLRREQGLPEPTFTNSANNGLLSDLAGGVNFDGLQVDCVLVYMDPERLTAEAVILPRAVDHASLLLHT